MRPKVFIGLSGGVDSSVAAALLKQADYEVIGVFIRVWEPSLSEDDKALGLCDWRAERREARRAAAHLDIPLLTLDLRREYKKKVVDYFLAEYKAGRTPNPDVMCNKQIKFGAFFTWALANGADFVATGHYAKIVSRAGFFLGESKDQNKDQTYFLWPIEKTQLNQILLPIGSYSKPTVRILAKKFGLPNATKKDSQGLCFIGKIDFKDFLKQQLKEKSGSVLDEQGQVIGRHPGVIFFTLGERHGFEIFKQSAEEKPYYVISKNLKLNTLTVSTNPHSPQTEISRVELKAVNWLGQSPLKLKLPYRCQSRVRYRQPKQICQITELDLVKKTATVLFSKPQLATPGQSLVFYQQGLCLGGGIID